MCAEVAQKEKCAFVSHGCTVRVHDAVGESMHSLMTRG